MERSIPLTVIGGYLGAGKTTLVNEVLRHPGGGRFGVVVNDIGEVAIDATLIESADDDTVTLSNGCVCCSLTDGFEAALTALRDPVRGLDHVLVEVSGVGDPWKVAQWGRTPGYELNAVVVLADVEAIRAQAEDPYIGETVLGQLRAADIVVLTKVDLAPETADDVRAWGATLTEAPIIAPGPGSRGAIELLVAVHGRPGQAPEETHADHVTRVVTAPAALERADWFRWLADAPAGVVRVKGIVPGAGDRLLVLQLAGRRTEITAWRGEPISPVLVAVASPEIDELELDAWLADRR